MKKGAELGEGLVGAEKGEEDRAEGGEENGWEQGRCKMVGRYEDV